MKQAARVALAIIILLAGFLFLPRPASRVVAPDAYGQVPTSIPTLIKTESPTPSPTITKTPKPKPPPPPEPGGDDDDGPGGGGDDDGKGGDGKDGSKDGSGKDGDKGSTKGSNKKGKGDDKKKKKKGDKGVPGAAPAYTGKFNATGEYTTDKLLLVAAKLKARGFSEERIIDLVWKPFIFTGPGAWTNTWGAPRYGPGPIVRTHEGQDVFCRYGEPVLASEDGTIEFDDGGLGGLVARLHRPDGSYWYYAHLSDVNDRQFKNGDSVKAGDIIGYCGNSGNAITTPPHVHFGWYQANGESRDPMGYLIRWLKTAERRAAIAYKRATGHSIATIEQEISSRRFGDSFAPDISELTISSESLLAVGGSSALGLAEVVLQAALRDQGEVPAGTASYQGAAGVSESRIAELLESTSASPSGPTGD